MRVATVPSDRTSAPPKTVRANLAPIDAVHVSAYTIPTDQPESDGTLAWDSTTIVVVEPESSGIRGLGYTYASVHAAGLIGSTMAPLVLGRDALDIPSTWSAMVAAVRNLGRPGLASTAI